jgi:hypothetical protein
LPCTAFARSISAATCLYARWALEIVGVAPPEALAQSGTGQSGPTSRNASPSTVTRSCGVFGQQVLAGRPTGPSKRLAPSPPALQTGVLRHRPQPAKHS